MTTTGATIYGLKSTGTGVPVWNATFPGCSSDSGGGTYTGLESSDSGNLVAFLCDGPFASVYGINGATGTSWQYALDAAKAGQVSLTLATQLLTVP